MPAIISYYIRYVIDLLRAQGRFVNFFFGGGGCEAAGPTPYTFYKPTLGPRYVSYRPYNESITPATFIQSTIGVFDVFPLPIFNVGHNLDSKYAVT